MIKTTLILHKLHRADTSAFCWCAARKHRDQLAAISRWISRTGDGPWYALIGLLFAAFGGETGWQFCLAALVAYGLDVPLYVLLKKRCKRQRPFVRLGSTPYLMPSDEFSFPSGHTAAATVWATLITAFVPLLAPFAWLWALAVGSSRVLLGVHYPGDILAGMVLGASCAALALGAVG
ncbi:MAG: phosphatase PAP2 family protein [Pseudomonadota bacterium]